MEKIKNSIPICSKCPKESIWNVDSHDNYGSLTQLCIDHNPFKNSLKITWTENQKKWCHNYCYNMARQREIDPEFCGVCHENCQDEDCGLEHSDFDI